MPRDPDELTFEEFKEQLTKGLFAWVSREPRRAEDWFYSVEEYAAQEYGRARRKRVEREKDEQRIRFAERTGAKDEWGI